MKVIVTSNMFNQTNDILPQVKHFESEHYSNNYLTSTYVINFMINNFVIYFLQGGNVVQ